MEVIVNLQPGIAAMKVTVTEPATQPFLYGPKRKKPPPPPPPTRLSKSAEKDGQDLVKIVTRLSS